MLATASFSFTRSRWFLNLLALVLVATTSAVLLYLMKDGPPSRPAMASLIAFTCLAPVLIRWQLGWMTLFLVIPWLSWLRRFQIFLLNEKTFKGDGMDITVLVPDAIMAATLAGYILTRHLRKEEPLVEGEWAFMTCIRLLIGLCVIEVFNPIMGSVSAGANGLRIFVLPCALYWLTREVVKTNELAIRWITLTAYFGAITGAYGAYQYMVGFPSYDMTWALSNGTDKQVIGEQMRAFSTFSFTSTFSHYMIVAVVAGFGLFIFDGVGRFTRVFGPIVMAITALGMAVTFVRSSFLGMIIACIVGLVVAGPQKKRWWRLLAVAVVAVGVLVASPSSSGDSAGYDTQASTGDLVAERVLSMKNPTGGSMSMRLQTWANLVETCATSYQAGVGLGAGASDRFGGDPMAKAISYTESQYFSMLAELGWVGFFLFIFLTFYGLLYSVKTYDLLVDPDRRKLVLVAMMMQVGILITGITGGTVLYTVPGNAYYWTALGLVTAMARVERRELEKQARLAEAAA